MYCCQNMSNLKSFVVGPHFEGLDSGYLMRCFGGNHEYPGKITNLSQVTYTLNHILLHHIDFAMRLGLNTQF